MVGVLYGLIAGLLIYKELKPKDLFDVVLRSMKLTGMIMFIICMAYGFAYLMASEQIPQQIADFILSLADNRILLLLMVNLLLLILGAIMDNVSAMVILSTVLSADRKAHV